MTIHHWLLPASWLYGIGVRLRNQLFDWRLLRSHSFPIPVISVGNLAVGGTGKTPHVEYILRLLQPVWKTAVLSRGYKRKTSGFVMANATSTAEDIGDEPMQIKGKFPRTTVAVDADRCEGIRQLMTRTDTQAVVLDDAFQHRYVHPGLSIVLIEHERLMGDRLLPAGRLREPMSGLRRADIVVVTKCPAGMNDGDFERARQAVRRHTRQPVFFSAIAYQDPVPVMRLPEHSPVAWGGQVLLVTGIANPTPLLTEIERRGARVTHLSFGDHHAFSPADIRRINEAFEAMPEPRTVVTTEKDATRLASVSGLADSVARALYQMPISVSILNDSKRFDQMVTDYVANTLKKYEITP